MPNPKVAAVSRLLYRTTGHAHQQYQTGMVARIRKDKTQISTQSVDFKAPHSAKTKQAWRYPGGQILRAPGLRLGNNDYEDPKDPGQPRRKQESNFFITINSNKAPDRAEEYDFAVKQMERMLEKLSDEKVLATYLRFGPKVDGIQPKAQDYRLDKYAEVVHSVDWKAAVEAGDVMRRVHSHIWLTITHYSQVQINIQMLMHQARKHYNEGMPLDGPMKYLRMNDFPYVHVKLLPQSDWTSVMRQYIHKGMNAA